MSSNLVILVGLPGSGKSTRALELCKEGYYRVNLDHIREMVFGDAKIQKQPALVVDIMRQALKEFSKRKLNIVVDNTNLTEAYRQSIIDTVLSENKDYVVNYVVYKVPLEECIKRNNNRDRNVPEEVIRGMNNKLELPQGDNIEYVFS